MTGHSVPALAPEPRWQLSSAVQPEPPGVSPDPTPLEVALRRKWSILAFAACGSMAMLGMLAFATPRYAATAQVRIDMPQPRVVDENVAVLPEERPTIEAVNTEMAALSSPALATEAARSMGLIGQRDFQLCPPVSKLAQLSGIVRRVRGGPAAPLPACTPSPEYAGRALLGRMSFNADRGSFVIDITASAPDAAQAARIANGYARSYVTWQRDLKVKLAQDADQWLSAQLRALHDQMLAADAAVEAYRQRHHLIGVHAGQDGQSPETLRTAQLSQLSTTLGDVSAQLDDKRSTAAEVRQALRDGRYDRVGPALQSPIVQSLLQHHADLTTRLAELRAHYGTYYPAVIAATAELARNDSQIGSEVARVGASLDSELAALASRHAAIAAHVASLEGAVAGESEADVGLEELQREAASDRSVYESSFVRLKQLDAERFLERANADIVVEAMPPEIAEFPRKRMMAVGAFLGCMGLGVGVAFLVEMMSRQFRDAAQIEDEIGLPVIGIFARRRRAPQAIPVDYPHSVEAETIHAVLTQLLGGRGTGRGPLGATGAMTTLVTSSLPGEGKSCFTVALGRAAASVGLSVFVVDCDVRRPAVRALIGGAEPAAAKPDARAVDIHPAGEEMIGAIMREAGTDPRSGLRYLSLSDYIGNPRGLLTWPGLPALLAHLRTRCDLVLLDAPPVLAVSDALHIGPLADRVLLMIDWQETPRDAVASAARSLSRAGIGVTGAVMSKVDMRRYAKAGTSRGLYVAPIGAYLEQAA